MAKLVHTWYVSFRPHKRIPANSYCRRMARSFPNEAEAKNYTRSQIAQGQHDITAGTLNPHLPKRTIPPSLVTRWLTEPDEARGQPIKNAVN